MRLRSLEIENFALIRNASMSFVDGLNRLHRGDGFREDDAARRAWFRAWSACFVDMVSVGAARMRVTLQVEPTTDEAAILVREMSASGKSSARINGRAATTAQLRALGDSIVDIVGQHEQQRLLSPSIS